MVGHPGGLVRSVAYTDRRVLHTGGVTRRRTRTERRHPARHPSTLPRLRRIRLYKGEARVRRYGRGRCGDGGRGWSSSGHEEIREGSDAGRGHVRRGHQSHGHGDEQGRRHQEDPSGKVQGRGELHGHPRDQAAARASTPERHRARRLLSAQAKPAPRVRVLRVRPRSRDKGQVPAPRDARDQVVHADDPRSGGVLPRRLGVTPRPQAQQPPHRTKRGFETRRLWPRACLWISQQARNPPTALRPSQSARP